MASGKQGRTLLRDFIQDRTADELESLWIYFDEEANVSNEAIEFCVNLMKKRYPERYQTVVGKEDWNDIDCAPKE